MQKVKKQVAEFGLFIEEFSQAENRDWNLFFEQVISMCAKIFPGELRESDEQLGYPGNIESKLWNAPIHDATIIPIAKPSPNHDLRSLTAKISLYSEVSVFVVPAKIDQWYCTYSSGINGLGKPDYESLLQLNEQQLSLVKRGNVIFMPESCSVAEERLFSSWIKEYRASFKQEKTCGNRAGYLTLNPNEYGRVDIADVESFLLFRKILLPFFPGVDPELIHHIRENETEAFTRFQYFIRKKLSELGVATRESRILEILEEIDYELAELNLEAKRLLKLRSMRGVTIAFLVMSLGTLLLTDIATAKEIAGIAGTTSFYNLIIEHLRLQSQTIDMKKSDMYVPFMISQSIK